MGKRTAKRRIEETDSADETDVIFDYEDPESRIRLTDGGMEWLDHRDMKWSKLMSRTVVVSMR